MGPPRRLLLVTPVALLVALTPAPSQGQPGAAAPPTAETWEDVSYGLGASDLAAVALASDDADVALVGGGTDIYRTDDRGDTWHLVLRVRGARGDTADGDDAEDRLEALAEEIFDDLREEAEDSLGPEFADAAEDALRQQALEEAAEALAEERAGEGDDEGTGATPEAAPPIRRLRAAAGEIFAATRHGLHRSTDGGRTFLEVTLPVGAEARRVHDALRLPDGTLLVASDAGVAWAAPGALPQPAVMPQRAGGATALLALAPAAGGPPIVLAGTSDGVVRSEDGGRTFATAYVPPGREHRQVRDLVALPSASPELSLIHI